MERRTAYALALGAALIALGLALMPAALNRYCPECVVERSVYPFTAMMAAYTLYAGLAAGMVIAATLARLGKAVSDKWASHTLWAALGVFIAAWITVFLDLGRPDHAAWLLEGWHATSRVAWMPVFYALTVLPMLALLLAYILGSRVGGNWALLGFTLVAAVFLEVNLGSVFGFSNGVPAWRGLYPAASFLLAGVAGGAAAAALLAPLGAWLHGGDAREAPVRPLAVVAVGAIILYLGFEAWRVLEATYDPALRTYIDVALPSIEAEAAALIIAAAVFLAAYRLRSLGAAAIASIITIATVAYAKYGFIIHGEEARLLPSGMGPQAPLNPYHALYGDAAYHVASADAAAIAAAILIGLGVFALGEALLALEGERPRRLLVFRKQAE